MLFVEASLICILVCFGSRLVLLLSLLLVLIVCLLRSLDPSAWLPQNVLLQAAARHTILQILV